MFSRLYAIWPGNGDGLLVSALHRFVTYLLTCLNTCPLIYRPETYTGPVTDEITDMSIQRHLLFLGDRL